MTEPPGDPRITVMRLLIGLHRHVHEVWFPDLTFPKAVAMTIIVNEIRLAPIPFTMTRLAKHLQITRPSATRRVTYLVRKGLVLREGQRITFNPVALQNPKGDEAIQRTIQMITEAASALGGLKKN